MTQSPRPRKSPTQARSQATYDVIIRAAELVLEQQGAAALTTTQVAKKAGVSVGSLYQYFPNKEALVVALIERYMAQLRETCMLMLQGVTELPLETLLEGILRMMTMTLRAQGRGVHRPLLDQVSAVGMARIGETNLEGYVDALTKFLSQRADVRQENLRRSCWIMVNGADGIGRALAVREDTSEDEAIVKDIARMFTALLRANGFESA